MISTQNSLHLWAKICKCFLWLRHYWDITAIVVTAMPIIVHAAWIELLNCFLIQSMFSFSVWYNLHSVSPSDTIYAQFLRLIQFTFSFSIWYNLSSVPLPVYPAQTCVCITSVKVVGLHPLYWKTWVREDDGEKVSTALFPDEQGRLLGMRGWGWFPFTAWTCDPKRCPRWNVQAVQTLLPPTVRKGRCSAWGGRSEAVLPLTASCTRHHTRSSAWEYCIKRFVSQVECFGCFPVGEDKTHPKKCWGIPLEEPDLGTELSNHPATPLYVTVMQVNI